MFYLKAEKIGDRLVLVPTEAAVTALGVNEGDLVQLQKRPNGWFTISVLTGEIARQVTHGLDFMDIYAETFRDLAKS